MSSVVICTIITTIGVIVSALVSLFVARSTAANEIKKMQLSWEREDAVSSDDEFAAMVSASVKYANTEDDDLLIDTLQRVASLRAKAIGEIAKIYDLLYLTVQRSDYTGIDKVLTELLNKKREIKSNTNPTQTHKPKK